VDAVPAHNARHHQNAQNSSAGHQLVRGITYADSTAENQPEQGLNKAENVAQQQRPFMAGKHARSEGLELKSLGKCGLFGIIPK